MRIVTLFFLLSIPFFTLNYASAFTEKEKGVLFKPALDTEYYWPFDAQLKDNTLYVLYSSSAIAEDNMVAVFKKNSNEEWYLDKTFLKGELSFPHTINFYSDYGLLITDTNNDRILIIDRENGEIIWNSESLGLLLVHPNDAEWRKEEAGKIFVSSAPYERSIYEIKVDEGIITNKIKIKDNVLIHDLDILEGGNIRYVDSDGYNINEIDRTGEIVRTYALKTAINWPRNAEEATINGKKFEFAADLNRIVRIKPDGNEVTFIEDYDMYNFHFTKDGILAHNYFQVYLIDYRTKEIKWSVSLEKDSGSFANSMENYESLKAIGYVR